MPSTGGWTGRNIAILVILLVVTNSVTGVVLFFATAPQPAPFVVVGPWAGAEFDAFEPVLTEFERISGIEVEFRFGRVEDLVTTLPTQLAAGQTPGDLIFMNEAWIRDVAMPNGYAMDVVDFVDETNFDKGALDIFKSGGGIFGGVWTGNIKPGFWYHQSFFDANSLTEPTTYAEFVTLLAAIDGVTGIKNAIVTGDGVGWPISDVTEHFLATYGGAQMNRDLITGDLSFTDASVKNVFNSYLIPLLEAGYFSEPLTWDGTAFDGWEADEYGLYFMGSWITGMVADPADLRFFALPPDPVNAVPEEMGGIVLAANFYFIPAFTDKFAEARWFFQFLMSPEAQELRVRQGGNLAIAKGVDRNAYSVVDRMVVDFKDNTLRALIVDIDDNIGAPFQATFWSQLQGLWTSATPAADLDAVLTALQADAEAARA